MNVKMICLGAFAFAALSGAALAGALDNPRSMSPFFTDSSMKTMKSDDELRAAWTSMSKADQDAMKADCADSSVRASHTDFCATMARIWGN